MTDLYEKKGEVVLPAMVNTKHDTQLYEATCISGERGYQREIFDGNLLYESFLKAKKGSDWKPQVQKFEMTYLLGLSKIHRELVDKTYEFSSSREFVLNERGKTRFVSGEQIPDRITKHALCDECLTPNVKKYLIYDNGASQTGKGIDFTRKRVVTHLRRYYHQHKSNDGYVLLIDFSKYYDNIRHDKLMEIFEKCVDDENALWLLRKIIDRSKVDVSYMTDEEYDVCLDILFNSLEHAQIDKSLLTKEKFMAKHLNIGDQVAQVAGIAYQIPIDNYVKIVKGIKFYGRYMDDSYVIHESKEYLQQLLKELIDIANSIGITINTRKTRICKLSDRWRFLQIQYSLTDTGRIIQKINPIRLTAMRSKMKKLCYVLSPTEFCLWYNAWFKSHYKLMSKLQRENLDTLFAQSKEICIRVHNHSK